MAVRSPAAAARAATILLATIVVGCTTPQLGPLTAGSGDLLPAPAAARVVNDYWAVNERAALTHDLDGFAKVEMGLLLEADRGQVQANRALAVPPLRQPRPLRRVTAYVPHQRQYPAQFVALLETVQVDEGGQLTTQPAGIYLHFARPSQKEPWKADFYALADLAHPVRLALERDGYATVLPAKARAGYSAPMRSGAPTSATWNRA